MAGLFSNTGDVMSNIMAPRQQANQALGSPYGKYGGIVQAGGMFADIGADAAAGGGYGAADPRMQQQKELKQIAAVVAQQFPGKTDSPDFYKALALAVQDKYPQKAQEAMQMAAQKELQATQQSTASLKQQQAKMSIEEAQNKNKMTQSKIDLIMRKNPSYSKEEAAIVANDDTLFKSFMNPPKEKAPSVGTTAELIAQTKYNKPFAELTQEEKQTVFQAASKDVTLGQGLSQMAQAIMGKQAAETAGKQVGKDVAEQIAPAVLQGKENTLKSLEKAQELLNAGIYSGGLANAKMAISKYTPLGSQKKLENTEKYITYLSATVIPLLKEFGGNDSNEELKFLQRVVGSEITLEEGTLRSIVNSAIEKTKRGIERAQKSAKAVQEGKVPSTEVQGMRSKQQVGTLKDGTPIYKVD